MQCASLLWKLAWCLLVPTILVILYKLSWLYSEIYMCVYTYVYIGVHLYIHIHYFCCFILCFCFCFILSFFFFMCQWDLLGFLSRVWANEIYWGFFREYVWWATYRSRNNSRKWQLPHQGPSWHRWQLIKDGKHGAHCTACAVCSVGWRESFPSESVGLNLSWTLAWSRSLLLQLCLQIWESSVQLSCLLSEGAVSY